MRWLRRAVQRWGGRAVGIAVTGIGLYVVAPSVITLFGAWPDLERVHPWWFAVLSALEVASFAALWLLLRISMPATRWRDIAASQAVGNAISKVVPGGAAAGGVMQGRMLVQAGRPAGEVTSALSATGLLTTGVLLALPILTVPTLVIGPPPARKLEYGLLVSFILAVAVMGLGTALLKWDRFVTWVGRGAGHLIHLVRRRVSVDAVERTLHAERDQVAAAFAGRWTRAVGAAAASRMFDYAALVAALYAVGAEIRPARVLLAYVIAMGLGMVPITPGGLGVVEAGLTTWLLLSGVSADQAVVGTLLYRLASYWLPIPLGALAWGAWHVHRRLDLPGAGPTDYRDPAGE